MARTTSIDPLRFKNFKLGAGSIVCKYDDSKADKIAEQLSEKNLYSNLFQMEQCVWTAIRVYIALRGESNFQKTGNFF